MFVKHSGISAWRFAILAVLAVIASASPAFAGCWSLLKSPKWEEVEESLGKAKLCEVIPVGPNHTAKLTISQLDVCDAPGGVRLHAEASLDCKSGRHGLIKMTAQASIKADVAVDIGTCTITDTRLQLGGAAGKLLEGRPEFQRAAQALAQAKLSQLCGK